ncbi:MAG TPA: Hpt domain-containing protein [Thiobacillaceae bacterium]|nr:Hpt domain-containing protein [Thiobacillaceae bacterium]HNU64900.1 Hpt domain-containing protein [Thiobacillaceae bacterium]
MNMDLDDFDIGPLTWVKAELDNALHAARQALADWNGEDTHPLKAASAHLHQVYGALQIVDLQGVSLLTSATERLLEEMSNKPALLTQTSMDVALAAIDALKSYLDGLAAGTPHAELRLAPVYRLVVTQRGGDAPSPSELFFPNTDARPPKRAVEPGLDEAARARAIHAARVRYQRGLLQLLQNKEPMTGLRLMEQSVRHVEELAPGATQHGFWWATVGLMEALRREAVPLDIWIKRLCGRIDLQMRRLMEGSRQLAERLFNDVLYYVAQDPVPVGRTAEVNDLHLLRRYFPGKEAGLAEELLPFVASLKDNLIGAKDHWIRYCGGRAESLEPFQQSATGLFEAALRLPNQAMKDLTRIVQAVAKRMPGVGDAGHNEALQVEMATALLLGLNAAEHFDKLGEEFARQAEAQAMRVQAAIDPSFNVAKIPQVDMLDEISRAAQDKLLLAQVTHEIQANLHQVEEILDRFFRDERERGGLPRVPGLLKQILGALRILQLDVASDLVAEAMTRIGHFDAADVQIPPENLDWVAEALSTLGLYVDALRYGRDDPMAMRRLLATPEARPRTKEVSVEIQAREEAQRLYQAVTQWIQDGVRDEASKARLRTDLAALKRDADLVGDAGLRTQADHLLQALDGGASQASVTMPAMARVEPSAETQRLATASSETVDQELLQTYIEEANDVLAAIAVQVSRLNVSPYDHEAFIVVRRAFHTLKGSGRMVGLTQLAEPAWEIEQTLNQWLRDERTPDAAMLDFLEEAGNAFQTWVTALEEQGQAQVRSEPLVATARRLRGECAVPETPPPKPDAGASVASAATAGETEPADPPGITDAVDLDGHVLPAELFQVFRAEGVQRLRDMSIALAEIARAHRPAAWEAFIRAAHTLAGISRTTGFTPLAEAAHAVERWAGNWPDKTMRLPGEVVAGLEEVIRYLAHGFQTIQALHFPPPLDEVSSLLAGLVTFAERRDEDSGEASTLPSVPSDVGAPAPAADQPDTELLPLFLEEADELMPRIGEALRGLRTHTDGADWLDELRRVLHTLKGSARMAGALGLGEEIHALETRVMEPQVLDDTDVDALEEAYDHMHAHLGDLRAGIATPPAIARQAGLPPDPTSSIPGTGMEDAALERQVAAALEHIAVATAPARLPAASEAPMARDELDAQLLPIFLEEAAELMPRIGEGLRDWRAQPGRHGAGDDLKRVLHTLKGSARMAGAMVLGERVHGMENLIVEQADGVTPDEVLDRLEADYDQLHEMLEALKAGSAAPARGVAGQPEATARVAPVSAAAATQSPATRPAPGAAAADGEVRWRQTLRLKADVLDTLLNEAGEVSIARARIENVLSGYKQTAQELAANVERLRAQLRELEIQAETQMRSRLSQMDESHFDPLEFDRFSRLQELTRQLAESVNDVSTAQDNLLAGLTEADNALTQQSRMTRTLQQELMHMRMVPLNTLAERMYRIVRQSAKETGRRAQLELEGGQTELDRAVLDKVAASLEHLVRNAVAHGVEPPHVRQAAGKPEYGEIHLSACQEGNEIVLTLMDDGAGVDAEAVRARAVARGWLAAEADITPEQVESFLFRSGFSTAQTVTELAGRGVGLDVVRSEIAGIGGRVRMHSTPGQGTRFTIRLPLTLALTQVVLARAGDQTWALPANLVHQIRELKAEQMPALHAQGYLELDGTRFPLRTLAELVDCKPQPAEGRQRTVLALQAGESRLALRVDALEGNLEAVVKPIGPQVARISGISGATVLGDGRVALILNPFLLAERAPVLSFEEEVADIEQSPLIMVVDDSLTVRKITSRLLEREAYRIVTARDGVEALEKLEEEIPAVMLLDIEMPRMDGFELTQNLRANPRLAGIPIIMITSRTADKHRDLALELGVDAYLGKPYQEEELLAQIARLVGARVTA